MVMSTCRSVPVSRSRPVPVLPPASGGPEPAAVRFKAAFRAAGGRIEPVSTWQARVPREG